MDLENSIYGYLHEGGEIVPKEDKQIQYKGGQQKTCTLDKGCHMLNFYDYARIYVLKRTRRVEVEEGIVNVQNDYCECGIICNHNSTEETHNSVASFMPHDLSLCPQPIIGSGHSFPNADEFRNALYTMSLVGRFQYKFKKNSPKRISVCCLVDGCPWRITANSVGTTKILKVNIFIDAHNHCADVECSSQPSMRGRRGARVIEQVIRATPQYLPRQICKDFRSRYGVSLKNIWSSRKLIYVVAMVMSEIGRH
ncbi:hypothetical protein AAG906_041125 [Vitis piasezkii]